MTALLGIPLVLSVMFAIQRFITGFVLRSFYLAQISNLIFGIGWGAMLVASCRYLFGYPHLDPHGTAEQTVMVFLLLIPALMMTLYQDHHVGTKEMLIFGVSSLAVIDLGLCTASYYLDLRQQPNVGLHLSHIIQGTHSII